jgi:hypothetical protein
MSVTGNRSHLPVISVSGVACAAASRNHRQVVVAVRDGARGGIAHVRRREVVLGRVVVRHRRRFLMRGLGRDVRVAGARGAAAPGTP